VQRKRQPPLKTRKSPDCFATSLKSEAKTMKTMMLLKLFRLGRLLGRHCSPMTEDMWFFE